jgi:hypothetical protein
MVFYRDEPYNQIKPAGFTSFSTFQHQFSTEYSSLPKKGYFCRFKKSIKAHGTKK